MVLNFNIKSSACYSAAATSTRTIPMPQLGNFCSCPFACYLTTGWGLRLEEGSTVPKVVLTIGGVWVNFVGYVPLYNP